MSVIPVQATSLAVRIVRALDGSRALRNAELALASSALIAQQCQPNP